MVNFKKIKNLEWNNNYLPQLIIVMTYVLSFGLILLNKGIYWDDWTIVNMNNEGLIHQFTNSGYLTFKYFLFSLLSFRDIPTIYRLITFFSFLGASLLMYNMLKKIEYLSIFDSLLIVLIFSLFPVNFSRISVAVTHHTYNYFLFFFGAWLWCRYEESKRVRYRLLSNVVLFLSFFTPSFLVFYTMIVIYLLILEKRSIRGVVGLVKWCLWRLDLFILPFFYWVMRKLYFSPFGIYEGYNTIRLDFLSVKLFMDNIEDSIFQIVRIMVGNVQSNMIVFVLLSVLTYMLLNRVTYKEVKHPRYKFLFGILFGLFTLFLGFVPYLIVGRTTDIWDWQSRQQLLLSLGIAITAYCSTKIIFPNRNKLLVAFWTLGISAMIVQNFVVYSDYQIDWWKQESIMYNMSINDDVINETSFVVRDNTKELNTLNRSIRFYEHAGMMKKVFGTETRFAISEDRQHKTIDTDFFKQYDEYNVSDVVKKEPSHYIDINYGDKLIIEQNFAVTLIESFVNSDEFQLKRNRMIELEVSKIEEEKY
jgi:hypothetical protein